MPKIEVWECPRTKKVFKTLINYQKHLKSLAKTTYIDAMIPRLKAEALAEIALIREAHDADELAALIWEHQSAIIRYWVLCSNRPERYPRMKNFKPILDIKIELSLQPWEKRPIHYVNEIFESLTGLVHLKLSDDDRYFLPNVFAFMRNAGGFTTGFYDRHTHSLPGYLSYEFYLIRNAGWPNIEHAVLAEYLSRDI